MIAGPALLLPFLIRGAVGGGVATATEVSTLAVMYAMVAGIFLYGGFSLRKLYEMLVETAALTGAILIILGTALNMAWVIAQSGVAQQLATYMTTLPGGWVGFMAVTMVVFLMLGCLLEGPVARPSSSHIMQVASAPLASVWPWPRWVDVGKSAR